jgi:purine-binding chemotaxis protein CheW
MSSAGSASATPSPGRPASELQLITFEIGNDQFALDIMGIGQILKYEGSTEIPKAPEFIEGIIVLRDLVIPIVDLRKRLFPNLVTETADQRILVVRIEGITIGLKVNRVRRIVTVEQGAVLPAPPLFRGVDVEFFRGVVRIDGTVVVLLDLEKVLTIGERSLLGQAAALQGSPT